MPMSEEQKMQRAIGLAKARAAKVAKAAAGPDPLTKIMGALDGLGNRLAALEAQTPRFVPISPEPTTGGDYRSVHPMDEPQKADGKNMPEPVTGTRGTVATVGGFPMPPEMFALYRPKFDQGSQVRINPEAVRPGSKKWTTELLPDRNGRPVRTRVATDEDRPWADALKAARSKGEGHVKERGPLSPTVHAWQYKCVIPGLTSGNGGWFWEFELMPL